MENKPFKYPEGGWLMVPGNRTPPHTLLVCWIYIAD